MNPIVTRLLRYIVDQVRDRDAVPTRTRVAKLLYLIDVEYYRRYGQTLTELPWRFLHYGPYAVEVEQLLQSLDLYIDAEEVITRKGYRAFTYKAQQPETLDDLLSSPEQGMIDRIIDRWALESLYGLLDYVYFETEPMQAAARGNLLDFSQIVRIRVTEERTPLAKLSQEVLTNLRERLKAVRESKVSKRHYTPPLYDDIYFQAIEAMDMDEAGLSDFRFIKNLEISEEGESSIASQSD
ncbi:hypothetical protein ES703_36038 [subsurface metagenome]